MSERDTVKRGKVSEETNERETMGSGSTIKGPTIPSQLIVIGGSTVNKDTQENEDVTMFGVERLAIDRGSFGHSTQENEDLSTAGSAAGEATNGGMGNTIPSCFNSG
ncbi:hypothetical protein AGABI2DRAFT_119180 [Agaricus bisporus var. bisporus H97]|uniref:hypothetical protein n=1 Tax=Agaricus bisporus var. bisporus (strain H97 / ATCC MYA-4626 / FGSC 10389) TaxID=936046 RepID=UPI00029F5695|nr:hypothetical protein AGABI2DRAFT_119180 [Agaricus bisporus var. bisporus H97]EKV45502.1 hypothetical protein AGABI2DRAFT_119180 [Agaricus bisporus var. bisporus H97]